MALPLCFTACSSKKKIAEVKSEPLVEVAAAERDGSSFEKAIVITEKSSRPGIDAEYTYIRSKYPACKMRMQQLSHYKGKPYDILKITTAEGKDVDVYFDISNFFGKF